MKLKLKIAVLLASILLFTIIIQASGYKIYTNNDPDKDKILIFTLRNILTRSHFVSKEIDDDFSEYVFNKFIDDLSPNKKFFTEKDIKSFSKYKYKIDNQILKDDISFYKEVFKKFTKNIEKTKSYYKKLLSKPFNYKKDETIKIDYKEIHFVRNDKKLKNHWRKIVKLRTLIRIRDNQAKQKAKALKDKKYKVKGFEELEKEAREEVQKDIEDMFIRLEELNHEDWFSVFLNCIVSAFDPHTAYLAPRAKEFFDQDMSGKLEGIGARLNKRGAYINVVELVYGGPAWKQKELEAGDIILEVAQGDKKPVDIIGMRLGDAVRLIKGKKGTEVRLTVKKKIDGSIKIISIIRDVVELEETFVKSSVVEKDGKKFGLINLPKFYIKFDEKNYRDSYKDMKAEVERLKKESVEGLIIDLRGNGGGSLKTAIDISGLFIDEGPVVQIKYRDQNPIVKKDTDSRTQWKGALVILVDEFSASASEIFAAAMQDYKRAVIIGGKQTHGKGTVQSILPINKFIRYDKDLGVIKITIQKFYRINGGSTQKEGVYSDIEIPSRYTYMKFGERDMERALPWDKIKQTNYTVKNSYKNFYEVVSNSKKRISETPNFNLLKEYAKWLKKQQDDTEYSLKYNLFVKESELKEKQSEKFKSVFEYNSNLKFSSPNYELPLIKKDSVFRSKRTNWHKDLSKDAYIEEAVNVLSELELKSEEKLVKSY